MTEIPGPLEVSHFQEHQELQELQERTGAFVPRTLIPNPLVDLGLWSVIACDQYTSPHDHYWDVVDGLVKNVPSAFHLIFPEKYLGDEAGRERRVQAIKMIMQRYLEEGILVETAEVPAFIYIERQLPSGATRHGLLVTLDLEQYDYHPGSQTLIRPTESTIESRLPVRAQIRRDAQIEIPHIMMFIDDPDNSVLGPLDQLGQQGMPIVDFDLMMGGGHMRAFVEADPVKKIELLQRLANLADPHLFQERYGLTEQAAPLLIAAGDGNHSLATAKLVWEETKRRLIEKGEPWEHHPARYALAEIVNLHDPAIEFEAIHRVLYDVNDIKRFLSEMERYYFGSGSQVVIQEEADFEHLSRRVAEWQGIQNEHVFGLTYMDGDNLRFLFVTIYNPIHTISVGTLQQFLDDYLVNCKQQRPEIDYLHGNDVVLRDVRAGNNIGFLLPPLKKDQLFPTVLRDGVTPRKTFSMGPADSKAFYYAARRIR